MIIRVPPGTWETLPFPRPRVQSRWERTRDARLVSPSEGNEAWRNGRQGVAAPHGTVEAGEPTRGTP